MAYLLVPVVVDHRPWLLRLRLFVTHFGRAFGVRVLSDQHFPVRFGRGGLQPRYLGRDRLLRDGLLLPGGRVMMERIAPSAHRGDHRPDGYVLRAAVRLRAPIAAADRLVRLWVRLDGARHGRRRRDPFTVGRRVRQIGRATDVLDRRFGRRARVVRPRFGRHADRARPDRCRSRRLRARLGRGGGRRRHGNGRSHRVRLSVRRHGRSRTTATPPAAAVRGRHRDWVRHGGHRRRPCRRGRHSDVPAHGHAIDAHLFGRQTPMTVT